MRVYWGLGEEWVCGTGYCERYENWFAYIIYAERGDSTAVTKSRVMSYSGG